LRHEEQDCLSDRSKSRTGAKTAVQTLDPKAWLPLSIC
jgi:hypothetical protein